MRQRVALFVRRILAIEKHQSHAKIGDEASTQWPVRSRRPWNRSDALQDGGNLCRGKRRHPADAERQSERHGNVLKSIGPPNFTASRQRPSRTPLALPRSGDSRPSFLFIPHRHRGAASIGRRRHRPGGGRRPDARPPMPPMAEQGGELIPSRRHGRSLRCPRPNGPLGGADTARGRRPSHHPLPDLQRPSSRTPSPIAQIGWRRTRASSARARQHGKQVLLLDQSSSPNLPQTQIDAVLHAFRLGGARRSPDRDPMPQHRPTFACSPSLGIRPRAPAAHHSLTHNGIPMRGA